MRKKSKRLKGTISENMKKTLVKLRKETRALAARARERGDAGHLEDRACSCREGTAQVAPRKRCTSDRDEGAGEASGRDVQRSFSSGMVRCGYLSVRPCHDVGSDNFDRIGACGEGGCSHRKITTDGRSQAVLKKPFGGGPPKPAFVEKNVASAIKRQMTELVCKSRREMEERVVELVNGALSISGSSARGNKQQPAVRSVRQPEAGQQTAGENSWVKVVKRGRRGFKPPGEGAAQVKPVGAQQ